MRTKIRGYGLPVLIAVAFLSGGCRLSRSAESGDWNMTLDQTMENAGYFRGTASPARLSIDSVSDRVRGYRYRPITADDGALSAAVLVPLYHLGNELHVILTKRTTLVTLNQGQISFPEGGRKSADQDLLATALRESFEEIGLDPRR